MCKRVLVSFLSLLFVLSSIGFAVSEEEVNNTGEIIAAEETQNKEFLQYYVKWDSSKEPEDAFITEAEYLETLAKDQNNNGILDSLEEETEVSAASIQTGILGDLNGDEYVDNRDVILMFRHIAGWEQDINKDILDFNGDGYTNNSDALHLMKYVSGWPDITLYKGKKNDIIYHLYSETMYQDTVINNTNPDFYYSSDGYTLKNIQADGYIFEGWYDGEGESAERIRKIDAGQSGEIELYARWTPRNYKIDFDSALVAVEPKYYTIETGATLTNPSLSNYIFVGWTEQVAGRLVRGIPKGSFGNITLVANWASRRNIAKPVQQLGAPVIAEDSENGRILFIYELGNIENVPLFTLLRFNTAEGITSTVEFTEQTSISETDAKTLAETIGNATSDSATWTLSEGWNNSTSVSEETLQQTGLTREEAEKIAKSSTNTYRMDTTQKESEVITDSSNHAYKGVIGTGSTSGTSAQYGESFKYSVDEEYGVEASMGAELEAPGVGKVKSEVKATESISVGQEQTASVNVGSTKTNSWNKTFELAGQDSSARTSSKDWNTTSSYQNSNTVSSETSTKKQISELISNKYGYGYNYSLNGNQSSGRDFTTSSSKQNTWSNTVTFNKSSLCSMKTEYKTDGKTDGYYRLVLAGTAHVFGVVGYDVASSSYFTYTITVMDDETFEFLDYSKHSSLFNDNEVSVIPFEIPSFVNDYVNSRIARTGGLQISNEGIITKYSGNDPIVIVPSYWDVYNGDGTHTSVKVKGLAKDAFRNNTNIQGVMLPEYISSIPDYAFEGCTSLRDIDIPRLTSIGDYAFSGCTSLSTLTIPENVTHIGTKAFNNVNEVKIVAANRNVALAAVDSGVKSLVLNIASANGQMKDQVIHVPSSMRSFEIQGGRKDYENLRIKSEAESTTINGFNFVGCTQVPMEIHSSTFNLYQTNVSADGYCMIVARDNCMLNLFGTNQMVSNGGNAIVCGNTTLANLDSSVQARLQVSGNVYVCGSITSLNQYLSLSNGYIINITPEQYQQYINGVYKLVFEVNGGTVDETERTCYSGAGIGELPIPTRTGYTFAGWYDAPSGGKQVNASSTFISSSSVSIYALWTANTYTVTFNANNGETVSPASKEVSYDSQYGTLATATRAGYTLEGWFTAASGGTQITADTKVTITSSQVLYAHWTLNPESGWVTESQVPANAIITQTSWSYREDKESTSSSMSGWTSNGSRWNQTGSGSKQYASFPSTYDTSHSTYKELNGSAYAASGGGENDSSWRKVSNTHAGYVYWHWAYNAAYYNITNRWISDRQQWAGANRGLDNYYYTYFFAFKSTVNAPALDSSSFVWGANAKAQNIPSYNCASCLPSGANTSSTSGLNCPRFLRLDYYTSTYTDYQKIYKYYRNVSYSTTDPGNGSSISNKVKYVKYRNK